MTFFTVVFKDISDKSFLRISTENDQNFSFKDVNVEILVVESPYHSNFWTKRGWLPQ